MSYEKYTTDALVLADRERGEHDKLFTLYTCDFGLVRARASAVRKMSSRMRPALPLFASASVSLVRGTQGWRIVGARESASRLLTTQGVHAFARIVQLLIRLVRGEGENQYLFETLKGARDIFSIQGSSATVSSAELLCVARTLYSLGYLSPAVFSPALFVHTHYTEEDLGVVYKEREHILRTVNNAIVETQL